MKEWFTALIQIGFLGIVARLILPSGEKSKLYPPLRFLLSLVLVVAVFSPIFSLFRGNTADFSALFEGLQKTDTESMEKLLLERSAEEMANRVRERFPEADFTLYIYTDEGSIPTQIEVKCEGENGKAIAAFLQETYALPTSEFKEGEDNNGSHQAE